MQVGTPVTTSFSIANYCAVCRCECRHCLLDSKYCATGVAYERGEALAQRAFAQLKQERPELSTLYYVGYCMDLPQIGRYLRFSGNSFLQCNGMGMKSAQEAEAWMRGAKEAGARLVDMTFYGVGAQHDAFAGRRGDFAYLLLLIDCAKKAGLDVEASIALTRTNMAQMPELYGALEAHGVQESHVFLSHAKGRGIDLTNERLTDAEFEKLCPQAKAHFSTLPHRTEAEWIARGEFPRVTGRNVTLVLTPENIERYEHMPAREIISELEEKDEEFYGALPPPGELARLVGRPENRQIYRFRDLVLEWQKRFFAQSGRELYDMNDERHSFSVRIYAEREMKA